MSWTHRYVTVAGAGDNSGVASDFSNAMTLAQAIADAATPHVSYCYNIQAGTYTPGDVLAFPTAGATTTPNWWRGCHTVAGDLDDGVTHARDSAGAEGTNMPLFDMSDDAAHQVTVAGAHQIFSNIAIKSACTSAGGAVVATGGNLRFVRVRIENTASSTAACALTATTAHNVNLLHCRLAVRTAATVPYYCVDMTASIWMYACTIIGAQQGINMGGGSSDLIDSLVYGQTLNGVVWAASATAAYCNITGSTIYNTAAAGSAIVITTLPTAGHVHIYNNILSSHNGISNAGTATNGVTIIGNHFYGCGHDIVGITENTFDSTVSDLGVLCGLVDNDTDPFVTAGSNFTLAAANVIDRGRGFAGTLEGQTTMKSYPDFGAIQHGGPANNKVATTDFDVLGAAGTAGSSGTAGSTGMNRGMSKIN